MRVFSEPHHYLRAVSWEQPLGVKRPVEPTFQGQGRT